MLNPAKYFRAYRKVSGYSSQSEAKEFLSGKGIIPDIDYNYISSLIERLCDIFSRLNKAVVDPLSEGDLEYFLDKSIKGKYATIKENKLIYKMNNQGRRPENVLFSWLRGAAIGDYFERHLSVIFCGKKGRLIVIGRDDINDLDTFKREPTADYSVDFRGKNIRLEVQAGFQGINDVKQRKWLEAKKILELNGEQTICVHFDIFNGQVAFINLCDIDEGDKHWVTRQQMEGQTVFNIDQNHFQWRLMDSLPKIEELELFV